MMFEKLVFAVALILIISCGSVPSDDATTKTHSSDTSDLEFVGTGTDITNSFNCTGEPLIIGFSHTGQGNFIVHLLNSSTGEIADYLVNEIGPWTGTIPLTPPEGEYFFEVTSDGDWEIIITTNHN